MNEIAPPNEDRPKRIRPISIWADKLAITDETERAVTGLLWVCRRYRPGNSRWVRVKNTNNQPVGVQSRRLKVALVVKSGSTADATGKVSLKQVDLVGRVKVFCLGDVECGDKVARVVAALTAILKRRS